MNTNSKIAVGLAGLTVAVSLGFALNASGNAAESLKEAKASAAAAKAADEKAAQAQADAAKAQAEAQAAKDAQAKAEEILVEAANKDKDGGLWKSIKDKAPWIAAGAGAACVAGRFVPPFFLPLTGLLVLPCVII